MIGAFLLPRFGRFWGWCQGKTSASPCWNSATSRPTMSTLEWFWGLQLGSWKNHGNNSRKVGGITWYNAITIYNCHKSYKYGTITVINPTYNLSVWCMVLHPLVTGTAAPRAVELPIGRIPVLRWLLNHGFRERFSLASSDGWNATFAFHLQLLDEAVFLGNVQLDVPWCTYFTGWAALNVAAMCFYAYLLTPEISDFCLFQGCWTRSYS